MDLQNKEWNDRYKNYKEVSYDGWLSRYDNYFRMNKNGKMIELGAGNGGISQHLFGNGYDIIASDYSEEALKNIKKLQGNIDTRLIDLRDPLPFNDNFFSIVIADLSLHYFTGETTAKIFGEICRVIKIGGYLMIRVNSTKDFNFGAGKGMEIEKNYYDCDYKYKRFFDEEEINKYLYSNKWERINISEYGIFRYENTEKIVWEVVSKKI